jgi:uncharacterized protein (TIGR02596 family)
MKSRRHLAGKRAAGFTLLELLAVIAIIGIFASMLGPVISGITMGSNVTRGGDMVSDAFKTGHMFALSHNKEVEIRFYRYKNSRTADPAYRAFQLFEIVESQTDSGSSEWKYVPLIKLQKLPPGTMLLEDSNGIVYSNLLRESTDPSVLRPDLTKTSMARVPGLGTDQYTYVRFAFRPDGGTDLTRKRDSYYVTVGLDSPGGNREVNNFYTVQVNPMDSKVSTLRP